MIDVREKVSLTSNQVIRPIRKLLRDNDEQLLDVITTLFDKNDILLRTYVQQYQKSTHSEMVSTCASDG